MQSTQRAEVIYLITGSLHMNAKHGPRREFLKSLGVLGLSALTRPAGVAQSRTGQRIDVHHHLFPSDYRKAIAAMNGAALAAWTVEQSIAEMDKGGIAASPFPDQAAASGSRGPASGARR